MILRDTLGADLVDSHVKLLFAEWKNYMRRLSTGSATTPSTFERVRALATASRRGEN